MRDFVADDRDERGETDRDTFAEAGSEREAVDEVVQGISNDDRPRHRLDACDSKTICELN